MSQHRNLAKALMNIIKISSDNDYLSFCLKKGKINDKLVILFN